ncbi:MAG: GAF domain-containing sensor histidine kinase [Candidatus Obscuribacterales bacterium]|nr:GAF domain-containing sensor histidine kinase [Candidatus Obscuribacterales bacterium]
MDDAQLNDLILKSSHLTYFRLAFSLVVLIFSFVFQRLGSPEFDSSGIMAAATGVALVNLIALGLFRGRKEFSKTEINVSNAVLLAADISALSYVVHCTQGVESDLFFLLLLPTLLASNVYERVGIFLTAFATSSAYLATVVFENASFIPYLNSGADTAGLTAAYAQRLWVQISTRSTILFSVSMIWAAFCHRMSRVVLESTRRLAEQLSANTRLLEELKMQSQREQLSNSISLALRRTLEPDRILSTTCSELSDALNAAHCLLIAKSAASSAEAQIWDSAVISGKSQKSLLSDDLKRFFMEHNWQRKPADVPFNKILISDRPFDNPDLKPIQAELNRLEITNILVRPIMYGNSLKGVLSILTTAKVRSWQAAELGLIDSVAGQVAIAIEHAELVEQLSETNKDLLFKNENLDSKNLELRQVQSQLIHQEKMASLGRIVAGIAHELNNPVNFVHGNLPYLKEYFAEMKGLIACFEDLPAEQQAQFLEKKKKINYDFVITDLDNILADLFEGTDRIRQIIRNLRSFSRLDEAELKEASIEESLESTVKILSQYYGPDKVRLEKHFANLPPVLCYPGKLNQVWMNLLANAAQALANREDGLVIVKTELEDTSFLVSIEDNGPGIISADQSKIFEPFFTTKPVGQGTGLGLSISHSIVERHGGRIWFESSPGKGTKFLVRLPLAPPPNAKEAEEDLAILESKMDNAQEK